MLMNYIHAFWVGGLICALVQILLDKTRLMPGRVMVLLVCTGSVLSALLRKCKKTGRYENCTKRGEGI